MPVMTAAKSLRVNHIDTIAEITASAATMPPVTTTGSTAAAMIEPGRASSMRRTRGVTGTKPINQKPPRRSVTVTSPITAIAIMMSGRSKSAGIDALLAEESRADRACDRAGDDEPVAGREPVDRDGDHAGDRPRDRALHAAPGGDEKRGEERRHQEIDAEGLRIGDPLGEQIAGHRSQRPEEVGDDQSADEIRRVGAATIAV